MLGTTHLSGGGVSEVVVVVKERAGSEGPLGISYPFIKNLCPPKQDPVQEAPLSYRTDPFPAHAMESKIRISNRFVTARNASARDAENLCAKLCDPPFGAPLILNHHRLKDSYGSEVARVV